MSFETFLQQAQLRVIELTKMIDSSVANHQALIGRFQEAQAVVAAAEKIAVAVEGVLAPANDAPIAPAP